MQNYVYRDRSDALAAPTGSFDLRVCSNCEFGFNSEFEPGLMRYDKNYDNQVPSAVFLDYYEDVARFLHDKFSLDGKFVVEIGCGKGTFLKTLCRLFPTVEALGVDPSYEANEEHLPKGNLRFLSEKFKRSHLNRPPALVICRHVLEHISDPVSFLKEIREPLSQYPETPIFIEVPELDWIVKNDAFWDFCYEHCNYFTNRSLRNAVSAAGLQPLEGQAAFSGQYQWIVCSGTDRRLETESSDARRIAEFLTYARSEETFIETSIDMLKESKRDGRKNVVWGMATKGVIFCNLVDPTCSVIDYCVDINQNKQNCLVPHTGHLISGPDVLGEVGAVTPLAVVIMNPNYAPEIKRQCEDLVADVKFVDALGNEF